MVDESEIRDGGAGLEGGFLMSVLVISPGLMAGLWPSGGADSATEEAS